MPDSRETIGAVFASLKASYRAGLPAKLSAFTDLLDLLEQEPNSRELAKKLLLEVHKFHGSAGSYGFPRISEIAGEWELRLKSVSEQEEKVGESHLQEYRNYLRRIENAARAE